jgi:hypothetical protein
LGQKPPPRLGVVEEASRILEKYDRYSGGYRATKYVYATKDRADVRFESESDKRGNTKENVNNKTNSRYCRPKIRELFCADQ